MAITTYRTVDQNDGKTKYVCDHTLGADSIRHCPTEGEALPDAETVLCEKCKDKVQRGAKEQRVDSWRREDYSPKVRREQPKPCPNEGPMFDKVEK